jgi:glucuronate isomerase
MKLTSQAAELLAQIERWPIVDPHSHINPHEPAARHFDEILSYHYYTEQAHSAGMPASDVSADRTPEERCLNVARWLGRFDNTAPYSWLVEIAQTFHGMSADRIGPREVEALLSAADHRESAGSWDEAVWERTNLECIFLTNEFDDRLEGFDTRRFVPCLRTDDLVLKLHEPGVSDRLRAAADMEIDDLKALRGAIERLFDRFVRSGAKACAISLPPSFQPRRATPITAATPVRRALKGLELRGDERQAVSNQMFWMIAECAGAFGLPFDLMIGPIRNLYPGGVAGGRDLFDRRVSLADYAAVFSHFGNVMFPVSTLSPDAGDELVAFGWIFPNVVPMGHWWYSNLPSFIAPQLRARLEGVPRSKLLGYYSDAYKLEFVLPKFRMYRRVLAEAIADVFMMECDWGMDEAVDLARSILVDNPRRLFGLGGGLDLTGGGVRGMV